MCLSCVSVVYRIYNVSKSNSSKAKFADNLCTREKVLRLLLQESETLKEYSFEFLFRHNVIDKCFNTLLSFENEIRKYNMVASH